MVPEVSLAIAQLVAGIFVDATIQTRLRSRKTRQALVEEIGGTIGVSPNVAAAVGAWLDRREVVDLLASAAPGEYATVAAAVVEPLRYELRAAGVDPAPDLAQRIVAAVQAAPELHQAGSGAATQRIIDDLEQLKLGQGAIYEDQMARDFRRLDEQREAGRSALDSCDFAKAHGHFLAAANLARDLDAVGAESTLLRRAVLALYNHLGSSSLSPVEHDRGCSLINQLIARRRSLDLVEASEAYLEGVGAELRDDFVAAAQHFETVLQDEAASDARRAEAWCAAVAMSCRMGDEGYGRALLAQRPPVDLDDEVSIVLLSIEIRTRFRLGEVDGSHVASFCDAIATTVENAPDVAERAVLELGDVSREVPSVHSEPVCRLLLEQAVRVGDAQAAYTATMGRVENLIEASGGWDDLVHLLDDAERHLNTWLVDTAQVSAELDRAAFLFNKGRAMTRHCLSQFDGTTLNRDALDGAVEALDSAAARVERSSVRPPEEAMAELSYWRGQVAAAMGDLVTAEGHFAVAARERGRGSPRVRGRALVARSHALLVAGRWEEAKELLGFALTEPAGEHRAEAQRLATHIENYVEPLVTWRSGVEAAEIEKSAAATSAREEAAHQAESLLQIWENADDSDRPLLLDYWARGGFLRVITALSVSPYDVTTVDAHSLADIEASCRILCPIFDTVVVKWKGPLDTFSPVIGAIPADYSGPGGHGYDALTGEEMVNKNGVEWGTVGSFGAGLLPKEISDFLSREGLGLVSAGRLFVVPAMLVGCRRSAIDWVDSTFNDRLLGGAVLATSGASSQSAPVLDLATTTLPFASDVPIAELSQSLDEMTRELIPYRRRVMELLAAGHLDASNWPQQRLVRNEISDAFRELGRSLASVVAKLGGTMAGLGSSIGTGTLGGRTSLQGEMPTSDALLGAVAGTARPWFPLWQLSNSGALAWSSTQPRSRRDIQVGTATTATWLRPGTAGLGFRPAIAL